MNIAQVQKAGRNSQLDFLRFAAILSVLAIHSFDATPIFAHNPTDELISLCITTFTRPAIAIFLFVSGMLWKADQSNSYLVHRIKRVVFPYLFFSIFAIAYRFSYFFSGKITVMAPRFVLSIFGGATLGPYYFVFLIITIYIISFILEKLGWMRRILPFLLLVTLALNILHAAYLNDVSAVIFMRESWLNFYIYRTPFIWLCYFLLGVAFQKYQWHEKMVTLPWLIRIVWLFFLIVYGTLLVRQVGNTDGYNSIIGTIYSISTIFFLLTFNVKGRIIEFISRTSYTIYLSHIFFDILMERIGAIYLRDLGLIFPLLSFSLSLIGAVLVYMIAKKFFKDKSLYLVGAA